MAVLTRVAKTNRRIWYGALVLLLAALLILSPAEATLGNVVKIVYLHGALERVAVLAFLAAGALGLAQMLWNRAALAVWTQAASEAAIVLWVAHYAVSLPAQVLAWGGITLSEPRVASATWILVGTLSVYLIARWMAQPLWMALAGALNAIVVLIILRGAINILHPFNPIFGSDSLAIKLFYLAITVVIAMIAFLLTRERVAQLADKS